MRVFNYSNQTLIFIINREINSYFDLESVKEDIINSPNFSFEALFAEIDQANVGYIDFNTLFEFFRKNAFYPYEEEIIAILRRLDKNDDGRLTMSEFIDSLTPKGLLSPEPIPDHQESKFKQKSIDENLESLNKKILSGKKKSQEGIEVPIQETRKSKVQNESEGNFDARKSKVQSYSEVTERKSRLAEPHIQSDLTERKPENPQQIKKNSTQNHDIPAAPEYSFSNKKSNVNLGSTYTNTPPRYPKPVKTTASQIIEKTPPHYNYYPYEPVRRAFSPMKESILKSSRTPPRKPESSSQEQLNFSQKKLSGSNVGSYEERRKDSARKLQEVEEERKRSSFHQEHQEFEDNDAGFREKRLLSSYQQEKNSETLRGSVKLDSNIRAGSIKGNDNSNIRSSVQANNDNRASVKAGEINRGSVRNPPEEKRSIAYPDNKRPSSKNIDETQRGSTKAFQEPALPKKSLVSQEKRPSQQQNIEKRISQAPAYQEKPQVFSEERQSPQGEGFKRGSFGTSQQKKSSVYEANQKKASVYQEHHEDFEERRVSSKNSQEDAHYEENNQENQEGSDIEEHESAPPQDKKRSQIAEQLYQEQQKRYSEDKRFSKIQEKPQISSEEKRFSSRNPEQIYQERPLLPSEDKRPSTKTPEPIDKRMSKAQAPEDKRFSSSRNAEPLYQEKPRIPGEEKRPSQYQSLNDPKRPSNYQERPQPLNEEKRASGYQAPLEEKRPSAYKAPIEEKRPSAYQSIEEKRASAYQAPDKRASNYQKPIEEKRASAYQNPIEEKRASNYQNPIEEKRASAYQNPIEEKRASNYQNPIEEKRASAYQNPIEEKRASAFKAPVEEKRPSSYQAPIEEKRASKYQAPIEEKRASAYKAPIEEKRASAYKAPIETEKRVSNYNPIEEKRPSTNESPLEGKRPSTNQSPLLEDKRPSANQSPLEPDGKRVSAYQERPIVPSEEKRFSKSSNMGGAEDKRLSSSKLQDLQFQEKPQLPSEDKRHSNASSKKDAKTPVFQDEKKGSISANKETFEKKASVLSNPEDKKGSIIAREPKGSMLNSKGAISNMENSERSIDQLQEKARLQSLKIDEIIKKEGNSLDDSHPGEKKARNSDLGFYKKTETVQMKSQERKSAPLIIGHSSFNSEQGQEESNAGRKKDNSVSAVKEESEREEEEDRQEEANENDMEGNNENQEEENYGEEHKGNQEEIAQDLVKYFKTLLSCEEELERCKQDLALRPDFNLVDFFLFFDKEKHGYCQKEEFQESLSELGVQFQPQNLILFLKRFIKGDGEELKFYDFSEAFLPLLTDYAELLNQRKPINIDFQFKFREV